MNLDKSDCLRTADLASLFVKFWGNGAEWVRESDDRPHEDKLSETELFKDKICFLMETMVESGNSCIQNN